MERGKAGREGPGQNRNSEPAEPKRQVGDGERKWPRNSTGSQIEDPLAAWKMTGGQQTLKRSADFGEL
jgi:hypothetical protein